MAGDRTRGADDLVLHCRPEHWAGPCHLFIRVHRLTALPGGVIAVEGIQLARDGTPLNPVSVRIPTAVLADTIDEPPRHATTGGLSTRAWTLADQHTTPPSTGVQARV